TAHDQTICLGCQEKIASVRRSLPLGARKKGTAAVHPFDIIGSPLAPEREGRPMIQFCCPGCNSGIEVSEDRGGNLIHCPHCGRPARVPTLVPIEPFPDAGIAAVRPSGGHPPPGGVRSPMKRFVSVLAWPVCRFGSP